MLLNKLEFQNQATTKNYSRHSNSKGKKGQYNLFGRYNPCLAS